VHAGTGHKAQGTSRGTRGPARRPRGALGTRSRCRASRLRSIIRQHDRSVRVWGEGGGEGRLLTSGALCVTTPCHPYHSCACLCACAPRRLGLEGARARDSCSPHSASNSHLATRRIGHGRLQVPALLLGKSSTHHAASSKGGRQQAFNSQLTLQTATELGIALRGLRVSVSASQQVAWARGRGRIRGRHGVGCGKGR
jgi:hypothetical protein